MNYLILFLLSIILARVQYMISKFNLNAPWSGYGAIEGVLNKSSDAPMVYRVLVPWLIGKNITLWKYELWQTIFILIMMLSIYTVYHLSLTLIITILITVTFWYDYWDWTIELMSFTLALMSLPLALCGAGLLALSRETAPLVGLVYTLHSHDIPGGIFLTGLSLFIIAFVRAVQGNHKLYCKRWMIRENIELLKKGNISAWLSIGLIILFTLSVTSHPESVGLFPLVVACITMAKINETRVFVSIVPYAALFIAGWIK